MTISDLFFKLKNGEIDREQPMVDLEGVESVDVFGGKSKDSVDIRLDKNLPLHIVTSSIGMFIEFKVLYTSSDSTSTITSKKDGLALLMANARNSLKSLPDKYENEETNSKHRLQNRIIS